MAEQVSRYFEILIGEVKKLALGAEIEADILNKLEFLKLQSVCDFERRRSTAELRQIWKNVDRQMSQHGIYESFKPSKRLWETIGMFVEVSQFRPVANREFSPLAYANVTRLFEAMGTMSEKAKVRSSILNDLIYLKEESKRPLAMRNMKQVQLTWKRIHTVLKQEAILKPFEAEPMKSRILDFLKGTSAATFQHAATPRLERAP